MSDQFPLFPELSIAGREEAQTLIDRFKVQFKKVAQDVLSEIYVDVACHIESDSWTNYRNAVMAGFRNYNNRLVQGEYDFKAIRQQIYQEYRDDIIKDLNQDMVLEIAKLKERIEHLEEMRREPWR